LQPDRSVPLIKHAYNLRHITLYAIWYTVPIKDFNL
jgi:hypothetical protein